MMLDMFRQTQKNIPSEALSLPLRMRSIYLLKLFAQKVL